MSDVPCHISAILTLSTYDAFCFRALWPWPLTPGPQWHHTWHDESVSLRQMWTFLLLSFIRRCLHIPPQYLVELCQQVAGVASRQHLQSAAQRLLVVPRHQLSSWPTGFLCGWSVGLEFPAGQLAESDYSIIGENSFRQSLKTFLFETYWCIQRIRGFTTMRYINRFFTYLLTYRPR